MPQGTRVGKKGRTNYWQDQIFSHRAKWGFEIDVKWNSEKVEIACIPLSKWTENPHVHIR